MKKSLLYILAVFVGSLLFGACEKHDSASDPIPNSCSEFFFTAPAFNSPSGSKVYWDDDGLWWNTSGDLVLINGIQLEIYKVDGDTVWKTRGGSAPVAHLNHNYYCCYIGQGQDEEITWDSTLYKNIDLANIVPMVGVSKGNLMTLKPCCAVLKIINLDCKIDQIYFPVTGKNKFRLQGDLDPVNAVVKNTTGANNSIDTFTDIEPDANGSAYVIMPMAVNQSTTRGAVTITYTIDGIQYTKTTRPNITINKGYVYVIDFSQVPPDA